MDGFQKRLNRLDELKVKNHLFSLTSPCYESVIYRIAFPESNILKSDALELYQNHFILFHFLNVLKNEVFKDNKYLHVDFRFIFYTDYPENEECKYYDEKNGLFCKTPNSSGRNYCIYHGSKIGDRKLEEFSSKYFYLNKDNFYNLNKETAENFLNGSWELLNNYEKYKGAFKTLGIAETKDKRIIKNRYKMLAKKYHPDISKMCDNNFNEINNAYRLLIRLLPLFSEKMKG